MSEETGPAAEGVQPVAAEKAAIVEEEKSGCVRRGCLYLIIIIILIILLLLFCAVPKQPKLKRKAPPPKAKNTPRRGVIGDARYLDPAVVSTYRIGDKGTTSKGQFIILTFKLKNVSRYRQVADLFMFELRDEGGRLYQPDLDLTERYDNQRGKTFRWPRPIGPGQVLPVTVVFDVMRGMKSFKLIARGFDLTVDKFVTIPINKYSRRGDRPNNLMPAAPQ